MKFDIVILLLIVIFILLIVFNIFNKSLEGFSFGSMPSSSSTKTDSQYDYLAPLPANNTWSETTQTNFMQKFNANLLAKDPSANLITTPSLGNLSFLTLASEIEANYYVENGKWPWDNYVNNIVNKSSSSGNEQEKEATKNAVTIYQRYYPNRLIYKIIAQSTLPQSTILSSLNPNIGSGLSIGTNKYLTCKMATQGATQLPDGTNLVIPANGLYPFVSSSKNTITNGAYTLDYAIFESIPGLTFDASACNICQTPNFNYFDASNNCMFSIKTPEAYNVYSGSNIKSTPASTSSSSSDTSSTPSDTSSSSSTPSDTQSSSSSSSSWF
jgi:hypothetical protein